jgi:predicted dehydrogenase
MLDAEDLDILAVATPNAFHCPLALQGFEHGCNVFCEKPMAMTAEEGRRMVEAGRAAGKRLMIDFSFRFRDNSMAMKRVVDEGTLGDIYFARTQWLRRRFLPGFGGWFGKKELSGGGPLIDLGVHRLDLALWLMGYPKPVHVLGAAYDPIASRLAAEEGKEYDVEDLAAAMIVFENGASLQLVASWASHIEHGDIMSLELMGTEAGLADHVATGEAPPIKIFSEEAGGLYDRCLNRVLDPTPTPLGHFIESIRDDKPHMATGEEGVVVMELLDAIYRSAETGAPVRVEE